MIQTCVMYITIIMSKMDASTLLLMREFLKAKRQFQIANLNCLASPIVGDERKKLVTLKLMS